MADNSRDTGRAGSAVRRRRRPAPPHDYRHVRARRRWLVVLAIAGIVVLHAALTARLFLSPEQVRFRIQTLLEEQSPGKATVGAASYELPFGVRLRDIELYRSEEQGGACFFRAEGLKVRGLLPALLRGEVALDNLVFEQPELRVAPRPAKPEEPAREIPDMPVQRVVWRGGTIHFERGALYEKSPPQTLRSVNIEFSKVLRLENAFDFEGSAASDLWGRCDLSGMADLKRRRLDAAVKARSIPIDDALLALLSKSPRTAILARNLERYGIKGTVDLQVETSVEAGSSGPPEIEATVDLLDCEATWQEFPVHVTGLRGQVVYDGESAYYRNIQGRAGTATLGLTGRSSNLNQRDAVKVAMHLVVRDRRLDGALYDAVSKYKHPRHDRCVLKEAWDRCGIQDAVLDLDYHSTWWQEDQSYQGKVLARVREGKATYRYFPYPLEHIAGTVRWEQGRGEEEGVTYIDKLTGQRGKASVELTGSAADAGDVDVSIRAFDVPCDEVLRQALHPRWRKTYDELRPEGTVAADIQIKGQTAPPAVPLYRLTIRPEGASFHRRGSPYKVDDVRGELVVDETGSVSFRNLRGRIGEIPIQFHGTVTAEGERSLFDIRVVADEVGLGPRTRALLNENAAKVYDQLEPLGKVKLTWRLLTDRATGEERQTTIIECVQDCSIRHERFPLRVEGLMGSITIEGSGRTTFRGLQGRVGRAAIEALEGEYVPGDEGLRMTLRARGLALDERLRRALPENWHKPWDEVSPTGEADVEYQYRDNPEDPKRPVMRVIVEPAGAAFRARQLPLPITGVSRGVITFDEAGNATINNVLGKHRGRTVSISGQVKAGAKASILSLDVTAAELALDQELRAALGKDWQGLFDQLEPTGTIGADAHIELNLTTAKVQSFTLDARLKGCEATWRELPVPVSGLRGSVSYAEGVATLTDVVGRVATADEVRLEGQVAQAAAGAPTRLRVRARNARLEPALRRVLPKEVQEALDALAFKGVLELVDVTVARPADAKEPTRFFGTVTLRDCSFERTWPFERVSGEVHIATGELTAQGAHSVSGRLALDRLVVKKLPVTGLRGQFRYGLDAAAKAPELSLASLAGSFCGGRLSGEAAVGFGKDAPFRAVLRLSGVDFKEFCRDAVRTSYRATGALDLRVELPAGRLKAEKGLIGDGEAFVTRGELGELPLVVALFRVLQLGAPERSLTTGGMRFGIGEKQLVVKELFLGRDTSVLTRASGTVGYDGQLKLTFVTSKEGGLISNFVGRTLDSLVQYEMRGTLDEPRVNPVPLPLPKTILDEIIRGFGIWQALTGSGRTRGEPPP